MPKLKLLRTLSIPAVLLVFLPGLAGCEPSQPKAQGGPPAAPQVTVAKPTKRLVPFTGRYLVRGCWSQPRRFAWKSRREAGVIERLSFSKDEPEAEREAISMS
jgi:hypothetical protein